MHDLTGQKFERLTAIEYVGNRMWLCKCKCGKFKDVRSDSLINGSIKSCGCLLSEVASNRLKTHGRTNTPEYRAWVHMLERCNNKGHKQYRDYGARGIKVCKRWHKFEEFFKDMGERPNKSMTLERKDNNKGYSPSNCIWATRKQQSRNKRDNHMETYNGETKCISEWAEIMGLNCNLVRNRLRLGWDFEMAITTPKMR